MYRARAVAINPDFAEAQYNLGTVLCALGLTEEALASFLRSARLVYGTPQELANCRISRGGIHWPDLDEDISVRSLLLGRRDGSSRAFLRFWLENKKKGRKVTLEDWMKKSHAVRKKTGGKRPGRGRPGSAG